MEFRTTTVSALHQRMLDDMRTGGLSTLASRGGSVPYSVMEFSGAVSSPKGQ
jgi:hypothetical protein